MKQPPRIPFEDERDRQITTDSRSAALDFMIAATQVLTIICLVKGNAAWKGSLSLLFIGGAAQNIYKYEKYEEKVNLGMGIVLGVIGLAFIFWFGITG